MDFKNQFIHFFNQNRINFKEINNDKLFIEDYNIYLTISNLSETIEFDNIYKNFGLFFTFECGFDNIIIELNDVFNLIK